VADTVARVAAAADRTVPTLRSVRRDTSRRIEALAASDVLDLADRLLDRPDDVPRWLSYELIHHHPAALGALDEDALLRLGRGLEAWGDVDSFACYLSGVAWREGLVSDASVHAWAGSEDRWWRRTALVSTVALNARARGGSGDPERTLAVCDLLKADRDDMVVKALSWALRELAKRDPASVESYVDGNRALLAPRVVREVENKLRTGLKNPRRSR
jgi:hypothetical protein